MNKANSKLIMAVAVVLLLQIGMYIYWGFQKDGFHVDEVLSYGLANSTEYSLLKGVENGWVDSSAFFEGYLTVTGDDDFDFATAYTNQANDVHPPFFYYILHFISSLFPGVFSFWFGIGINIFFSVGINLLVFLIAKLVSKRSVIALASMVLYGFSVGAISMVIYIRMYVILIFFCCLLLYSVLVLCQDYGAAIKKAAHYGVLIASFFGFFTHYYYLIFAAAVSLAYCMYVFCRYGKKHFIVNVLEYVFVVVLGFLINFIVYPYSLKHILVGSRGTDSIDALVNVVERLDRIGGCFNVVADALFVDGWILALVLMGAFVLLIVQNRTCKNLKNQFIKNELFYGMAIASVVYFCLIAILAPGVVDRYQSPIFPMVSILFVAVLYYCISFCCKNQMKKDILLCVITVLIVFNGFVFSAVNYTYYDKGANQRIVENLEDANAIVLCSDGLLPTIFLELNYYDNLAMIESEDCTLEYFDAILSEADFENNLVIYCDKNLEYEEYEEKILAYYETSAQLYENEKLCAIYYTN